MRPSWKTPISHPGPSGVKRENTWSIRCVTESPSRPCADTGIVAKTAIVTAMRSLIAFSRWQSECFPLGLEHDLAVEQGHQTLGIFDLRRRDRIEVAIPHREVRVLPRLDRADLLLEEHLAGRPDCDGTECGVNVDRLGPAEWIAAID